jgi:HlyD family secretion protein
MRGRNAGMAGVVLAVALGVAWGYWPRAVLVELAPVERGTMQVTVEEEGRTRVHDRYVVSAPVPGYVRRIELHVGDRLEAGAAIAELEPLRSTVLDPRSRAEAEAQVAAARSGLARARADVVAAEAEAEEARSEFQRRERLCEIQCVSEEELERARTRMRRSEAVVRAANHAVEVARYELDAANTALEYSAAQGTGAPAETVQLRAPVPGSVLRRYQESEGVVTAGQPLVEIGDPAHLEVEVDVLSQDAVRIAPGTRVMLERWGGGRVLEAQVRTVEPTGFTKVSALGVEEQRVLVIADIVSPTEQWQRLGDGYRVEAVFVVWSRSDVLKVPASALFRHDGGWAVFRVDEGRARLTRVDIGQSNGLEAQVTEGLDAGEYVITHPDDEVSDGRRVRGVERQGVG